MKHFLSFVFVLSLLFMFIINVIIMISVLDFSEVSVKNEKVNDFPSSLLCLLNSCLIFCSTVIFIIYQYVDAGA